MSHIALPLVIAGLLLNLFLVALLLGDAQLPLRLSLQAAAALAAIGGLSLTLGLVMLEPRGERRHGAF